MSLYEDINSTMLNLVCLRKLRYISWTKTLFRFTGLLTKVNLDKAFRKYPIPNAQRPGTIKALPYSFIIRT